MGTLLVSLIITATLIGIPTWLTVRALKKVDENTRVYSSEEVTERLRRGYYLSNWGIELALGAVLSYALMFCDVNIVLTSRIECN